MSIKANSNIEKNRKISHLVTFVHENVTILQVFNVRLMQPTVKICHLLHNPYIFENHIVSFFRVVALFPQRISFGMKYGAFDISGSYISAVAVETAQQILHIASAGIVVCRTGIFDDGHAFVRNKRRYVLSFAYTKGRITVTSVRDM